MRRAFASALCLLLSCAPLAAQTDAQRAEMEATAARLAESPRLTPGSVPVDVAPAEGQFFWIVPEATGIYSIALDGPGVIRLSTFPNADGQYDGETAERVITQAVNAYGTPSAGPFLLSEGWPYLLSVNALGPANLTLTQMETLGPPIPLPERDTELGVGDYLFALSGDLRLSLPDPDAPLRLEVLSEPRATLQADAGGATITGPLEPFDAGEPVRLNLRASAPDDQPPPLVLLRIAPFAGDLDETEPNRGDADTFEPSQGFTGLLLSGTDVDRMAFSLPNAQDVALSITTEAIWADFGVLLEQIVDGPAVPVLRRRSTGGNLAATGLHLAAGDYVLELSGDNPNPGAIGYRVALDPGSPAIPGQEAEPNDHPAAATALTETGVLRGNAAADDIDFARFGITTPNHLWRIFALNADRMILRDKDGVIADVTAVDSRAIADALALVPGDYTVEIRGGADYALRLMDLGPQPPRHEAEPNDTQNAAQLLPFDTPFTGAFTSPADLDIFQFRLGAETPVRITVTPAGDGPMDAQLYLGASRWGQPRDFAPGDESYIFDGTLPPGDWFLQLRARSTLTRGTYQVSVARSPEVAGGQPDDTPATALLAPLDGDVAGVVGAFDAEDHIITRLPATPRAALIACDAPTWSLWPWSGGRKITNPRDGLVITEPDAEVGGGLRIVVSGDMRERAYQCAVRFRPDEADLPAATAVPSADLVTLAPGAALSGILTRAAAQQRIALDIAEGAFGVLACFDGDDAALSARDLRPRDLSLQEHDALAPFIAFRAGPAPGIELRASLQEGEERGWRCALLATDDMPRLADLGDLAALTTPPDAAPALPGGSPGLTGTPPSLDALLALVPPATQAAGDLPVTVTFAPPPPVAAYAQAGQRMTVGATLSNDSDTALDMSLATAIAGDRWQAEVMPETLQLAPGASADVSITLTAPPWLSPVVPPTLSLTATAGARFTSAVQGIDVVTDVPTQGAFTYYDAPDALRGGLNLLHYGLGARLVEMEGDQINDRDAEARAYLHDGLAPHANLRDIGRDLTFALPAPAQVAGAMIQLRSNANPLQFPGVYEVYLSTDGSTWTRVATGDLHRGMTPQYVVFDAPAEAGFIRFRFPDCPPDRCNRVYVQELQAIGVPGEHPAGWPAINAADPALGGHVVYSQPNLAGSWNATLLQANPETSNSGWQTRSESFRAVIGFHQNRAALVQEIIWTGHPKDEVRPDSALIEASLTGPAGPWTEVGTLIPPAVGAEQSSLTLETPVWARYLRVSFPLPADTRPNGPDAIAVIEAPGTSVIGLWEDDRPEAAYEATTGASAPAAVVPAGGADRNSAVDLSPASPVTSSVLLERNEDWWRVTVPEGPMQEAHFDFQTVPLEVAVTLSLPDGTTVPLEKSETGTGTRMTALLAPGAYHLRVHEPPRSVVITWDTSGSVSSYIPKTLAAVRLWSESLVPGRDVLQLLPFATTPQFVLDDWAEAPEDVAPALRDLVTSGSSASESALAFAADALSRREGARGVVIITDGETGPEPALWSQLLRAQPRVVALSIDSDTRQNATIMMDWANLNRGRFQRVVGAVGLADGMDMAAALFRAPKSYDLTLSLAPYVEPEGEATITLALAAPDDGPPPAPSGAVEVILDASGSMLQRLDGERRIAIAHDALSRLVAETLPEGIPFAFRAFGLEADACRSELFTPLAPLDRRAAERAIRDVPAINNARTAIADSLTAAADDLADAGEPRVIVLVTDGEETCDGDPEAAIAAIRDSGIDIRVNIVGFAIDDAALAETFAGWAAAGNGAYFEARDSAALDTAMDQALTPVFGLRRAFADGRVEAVGKLSLGQTLTVPAGQIAISPEGIAAGDGLTVRLLPGEALQLSYDPVTGLVVD